MSNDNVGVNEPDAGDISDRIDTELVSVGGTPVHRQRQQVAGAAADDIAIVTDADPASDDHGLVVRIVGTPAVDGSGVTQPVSNAGLTELAAAINANELDVNIASSGATVSVQEASALDVSAATVTIANTNVDNLHSADFDTGAGTDTTPAVGIAVPASGGAAVVPGDGTAGLKVDLGADNDVTVSGTVTVDGSGVTQPVSNAGLTELAAAINANEVDVNIASSGATVNVQEATPLDVSGAVVSVDDNAGSLTVDNTNIDNLHSADFDTGAGTDTTPAVGIAVPASGGAAVVPGDATAGLKVDLGADNDVTVSGTVTVDGSGVTQPVSNTGLSELAAAINANELDINIASDSVGIGGGTQYTEDAAAAANPVGNQPVMVRADTPAAITSDDGDVIAQRATDYGAAYCQILDSSGNFINSFGGSGGTSHADDAAFSIGSASSITPAGFLADDTTPDSVDEGDVGVPRMTLTRKPYAVITDPTSENNAGVDGSGHLQVDIAADSVGVGGGTQYTDDTDTHSTGSTVGTAVIAAATPTDGSVDANDLGVVAMSTDRRLHVDAQIVGTDAALDVSAATVNIQEASALDVSAATVNIQEASALDVSAATVTVANTNVDNLHSDDFDTGAGTDTTPAIGIAVPANGGAAVIPGDATAGLKVDLGADNDVTVSGTVTVDGSGVTQPVSNAGLTELAAAINGNELDINIATDSVGIGGGTEYTDDTDTHSTGVTAGKAIMAAATPTDGSVDANDLGVLAMSTDRRLHVDAQIVGTDAALDVSAATVNIQEASALDVSAATVNIQEASALDVSAATVTVANTNVDNLHSDDFDTGGGTDTTPAIGIAVPASGGAAVIPGDATAGLKVDLGSDNDVTVSGTVTVTDDGSFALAANSGVDIGDVDVTSISAGSNLVGDVGLSGARTSGGTTLYKNIDVDESEDQVKGSAGQVYWIHAINLTAAPLYLKLYNATAASVTVGSTTPDLTFPVPGNADSDGAGFTLAIPNGIAFDTAITIACTTGVADNDSGAPGANELVVNLGYA